MNYNSVNCPACKDHDMAPILYGYPTLEMVELARQDVIALGGCVVSSDKPTHYCYGCNETAIID